LNQPRQPLTSKTRSGTTDIQSFELYHISADTSPTLEFKDLHTSYPSSHCPLPSCKWPPISSSSISTLTTYLASVEEPYRHVGTAPGMPQGIYSIPIMMTSIINTLGRGAICASCNGRGFNIYICVHCNPAAAAAVARSSVHSTASPATANTTPGSSAPSSPGSLSRSPSTSYPSHSDTRATLSWKRYGDGRDRSCGQVEADTPRNL